ncbi:nucleolar GTP-binding protein 1-like [Trifolium pratense]|uniref:Nucleolar GTP-binding protein 1-like n=1 Tax=Trifolium pratense TaxID=57577 RepID=A0A2K3JN16_TRIPR|nr:nucleolar GTP-binding protein 1-like [Trifolium pratense]
MKLVNEMKADALKTAIGQGGEGTDADVLLTMTMSALTEEGVIAVRNAACFMHVAFPKPRDQKERPPCIPPAVLEAKQAAAEEKRKTEKDLEEENGGAAWQLVPTGEAIVHPIENKPAPSSFVRP